jgi:hypothetical protein
MLEPVEIRPPGFVQGYDFAVNTSVGWKISERFCDLRESFVEVLTVPRVQDGFAAGLDPYGPITVQFNFVGPIWSLGRRRD